MHNWKIGELGRYKTLLCIFFPKKKKRKKPTRLVVLLHVVVVERSKVANGQSNLEKKLISDCFLKRKIDQYLQFKSICMFDIFEIFLINTSIYERSTCRKKEKIRGKLINI